VAHRLLADAKFARAVTATTRAPRPGERDGADYHFLTEQRFREGIAKDEFLEWAKVHQKLYGTPRRSVGDVIRAGKVCLLVIDVQGAATLRGQGLDALFLFLSPPNEAELENRLRARGTEDHDELDLRLRTAVEEEMPRASHFDHVVVNDDLERAAAEIKVLVSHRQARPGR
jgi:guanylate kinase